MRICVCENGHAQTFVILARFIQGWTAFLCVEFVLKLLSELLFVLN